MTTQTLRMFTNDSDYVIAESAEDARSILRETVGELDEDMAAFVEVDNGTDFDFQESDGETTTTKTVGQWIAEKGRGYFAGEV